MMRACGSAQVVFDADGNMRVMPVQSGRGIKRVDEYADAEF
jgi:hypothetical protein